MNLKHRLLVSEFDYTRLRNLLQMLRKRFGVDAKVLAALDGQLEHAAIVPAGQMPRGVVTMNSRIRLVDLVSAKTITGVLVFPGARSGGAAQIPVFSSLGMKLLGRREGDTVVWRSIHGVRQLLVDCLLYQPEAAGNFAL